MISNKVLCWIFIVSAIIIGLYIFYQQAYENGYNAHTSELTAQAAQFVIKSKDDAVRAFSDANNAREKINEISSTDEECRFVMSFDVRKCLQ